MQPVVMQILRFLEINKIDQANAGLLFIRRNSEKGGRV
jgi:hypothetical protein